MTSPSHAAQKRYESNKFVNTILARHAADLTRLSFSCSSHSISLSGHLAKQPAGEFNAQGVEALLKELENNPHHMSVQCAFCNWDVAYVRGSWDIKPKRAGGAGRSGGEQVLDISGNALKDAVRGLFE